MADREFEQHPLAGEVERSLSTTIVESTEPPPTIGDRTDVPELSLFAGFLGDKLDHAGSTWWLLFTDARLQNWMLVEESDVVVFQPLKDDKAPYDQRDVLWVKAGATLVKGSGARTIEGRFVVGEFTRAGDFAASTTGGTFSAATGLMCEATTPGCCWGSRTR
jgi:hypothetical protein